MSRYGPLLVKFYAPTNLATPLSVGGVSTKIPVRGETTEVESNEGHGSLTFVNDSDLGALAAVGNICYATQTNALRTDLGGAGVVFCEPFIIRSRRTVPGTDLLTVSGPDLISELRRYTIYRPLGSQITTNTTLSEAVVAPITTRTLEVGAPRGNDTMQVTTASDADIGFEIRILMDNGATFITVVTNYIFWEDDDHMQIRDRLSYDVSSGNSYELRARQVKPADPAPFKQGCEVTVTTNSGTFITLVDEGAGEDGIVTLRDGIPAACNVGNAIQCRDFSQPSTNDVTQVLAFAIGWSGSFEAGTGTATGTRYGGGGDTVYEVLRTIAEETGEYFRIRSAEAAPAGPKYVLRWLRTHSTIGISGTLRLVEPAQSAVATDNADRNRAIMLTRPEHQGIYDPVTQLIPSPGDQRITLFSCSDAAVASAASAGYSVVTTNLGLYAPPYVQNDALHAAIGVYQRPVSFSEVTVEGDNVGSIQAAADKMLALSIAYLEEHITTAKTIRVDCISHIGIRPGDKIELVYASPTGEYSLDYTGANALYVAEVRRSISESGALPGVPITSLVLTPVAGPVHDAASEIGKRLTAVNRLIVNTGTPRPVMTGIFTGTGGGLPPPPPPPGGTYLPLSGGTMTGNIAFSGAQTVDGVDISAHVANANAHHAAATSNNSGISVTGQAISAVVNTTGGLELNTGLRVKRPSESGLTSDANGLVVAPNSTGGIELSSGVRVKLPTNSGLTRDANGIYLAPSSLTAATTNAVSGSGHTHAVTTSANTIGAGSAAILASGATGELALERLGVGIATDVSAAMIVRARAVDDHAILIKKLTSQTADMWRVEDTSANPLIRLTGGGNLESGTPAFVPGRTGWSISAAGDAEFNDIVARGEFHASVFVADELHATGGTLAVLTTSKVEPPVGANDNKLPSAVGQNFVLNVQAQLVDPGGNYFPSGTLIRCKFIRVNLGGDVMDGRDVYMSVAAVGPLTGRDVANNVAGYYQVTCTWLRGGETGYVIPTGTALVKWGKVSSSGYTGNVIITSDMPNGPYMDIATLDATKNAAQWQATLYDPIPRVRLGNLKGVLGNSADQWGMAAGTDLSDATTAARYIVASDAGLALRNIDLKIYDGANPTVEMTQSGVVRFGTDIGADATTSFYHNSSSGAVRVGNLVSGKGNLYWDGTHLMLRQYTTAVITLDGGTGDSYFSGVMGIGTSGGIYQGTGTFSSPTTGLKIWRDSGIGRLATYSGGTAQVYFDTTGKLLAGAGVVVMDADGYHAYNAAKSEQTVHIRGEGVEFITSTSTSDTARGLNWLTGGSIYATLLGHTSGSSRSLQMVTNSTSGSVTAGITISALNLGSSKSASIYISAGNTDDDTKIHFGADLSTNNGLRVGSTGAINKGQIASDFAGAHDYNAIVLQDTTDVDHDMTSIVATGTYGALGKRVDSAGGLLVTGASSGIIGAEIAGYGVTESTSTLTTSQGTISLRGSKRSGSGPGVTDLGSTANVLAVVNNATALLLIKGNGDIHANTTLTQNSFDDHDDVALIRAADLALAGHDIDEAFGKWLSYNRADLERLGLVSAGGFVNMTRMQRLMMGALWQVNERLSRLERGV